MKTYFLLVLALGCISVSGQDGKLLDRKPYVIGDSSLKAMIPLIPEMAAIRKSVKLSRIHYLSDGLSITGYIAEPAKPGKYPCIIYNRGGNRDLGRLNDWRLMRFLGVIASWGYVVVGSQYRSSDGSEGQDQFGGDDIHDVLNLLPLLDQLPNADTSRIGMYGWSRGGMMTYLALCKTTRIKAAVTGGGLSNLFIMEERPEIGPQVFTPLIEGYTTNRDSVLRIRSAVFFAEKMYSRTPILLMHGAADKAVRPETAIELATRLLELKRPFRLMLFEGGQHSLSEHYVEVNRAARQFLDDYVRDRKQFPNPLPHED